MAFIPESVRETELSKTIQKHLKLAHRGKVRDTYEGLPYNDTIYLTVATDRISIFDFVLGSHILGRGEILTAMTVFWLSDVLGDTFSHHLAASGKNIDIFLPDALRGNPEIHHRGLVVKKLQMLPIECIARGYLTGSGWAAYRKESKVCGHKLPEGLCDGAKLPTPIFTPTTKALNGHDEHLDAIEVNRKYGRRLEEATLAVYRRAFEYALQKGVIVADTKFEFGKISSNDNELVLADEVLTPDSSRFWDYEEWETCTDERRTSLSPTPYDKQFVRAWGSGIPTPFTGNDGAKKLVGINKLDPKDPEHVKFVSGVKLTEQTTRMTQARYTAIFERLTGRKLEEFQENALHR